jgi:hypothetical protein
VTAVPTAYTLYSAAELSGVVTEYDTQTLGSACTPVTLATANGAGFGAQLQITTFGATLAINVIAKQSWTAIIASVLAIISGTWTVGRGFVSAVQILWYKRTRVQYHRALSKAIVPKSSPYGLANSNDSINSRTGTGADSLDINLSPPVEPRTVIKAAVPDEAIVANAAGGVDSLSRTEYHKLDS